MKKLCSENIKNSSRLLIIVSGILLFLLVIFISYSIFGDGKGTYSDTVNYSCNNGTDPIISGDKAYCCDAGWHINKSGNIIIDGTCIKDDWTYDYVNGCHQESATFQTVSACNAYVDNYEVGTNKVKKIDNNCSTSPYSVTIYYEGSVCHVSSVPATVSTGDATCNRVKIDGNGGTTVLATSSYKYVDVYPSSSDKDNYISKIDVIGTYNFEKDGVEATNFATSKANCDSKNYISWSAVNTYEFNGCPSTLLYACWNDDNTGGGTGNDSNINECTGSACSQWWKKGYWCTLESGTTYKCSCEGTVDSSGKCDIQCRDSSTAQNCEKYRDKNYTCDFLGGNSSGGSFSCTCNGTISDNGTCVTTTCSKHATITYDANGGNSAPESQTVCIDNNVTLAVELPTANKKTFINWNTKSDGSGTSYSAGQSNVKITSSITLYAQWETVNSGGTPTSCTYKINKNGGTYANGYTGEEKEYSGKVYLNTATGLKQYINPPSGKCFTTKWVVKDSNGEVLSTSPYSSYIFSDDDDCGITLIPQFGSCSNNNDDDGNNNNNNNNDNNNNDNTTDAEYSQKKNDDRCYKGQWVKVTACQPYTVTNAKCKISTGDIVDRDTILSSRSGCDELSNPYSKVIDDYRCNQVTGKWIYITSCQSSDIVGAQCKYTSGTVLITDLTTGAYCNDPKPTTSTNTDKSQQDVSSSAQTGTLEVVIAWVIGVVALCVSFYYFRKNKVESK